jgi:CRP/FNR family nitrogen fixation transcriptional regulator
MTFQTSILGAPASVTGYLANAAQDALTLYRSGAEIYGQGELAGPLYALEFGCVRIGRFTTEGKRQVCSFCFAGDVFGWEEDDEHRFFAEAIGESGIRLLRPHRDGDASSKLMPLVVKSLTRSQEHLLVLARTNVHERLAAFLCNLAERQGRGSLVRLPMQRADIADYLGVSFETISRVLRRFKDEKLIHMPDKHSIEILELRKLKDMCTY